MSKHWLTIVLFISLAFNLAVMLMFSYVSIYHRQPFCPPGMRQSFNRDRDRDHDRKTNPAIKKLLDENKVEMEKYRADFAQKRLQFLQTLSRDTLNIDDAEVSMEASLKAHGELERKLGNSLINLRKNMTNEDARVFFKKHMDRMHRNKDDFRPRRDKRDSLNKKINQKRR